MTLTFSGISFPCHAPSKFPRCRRLHCAALLSYAANLQAQVTWSIDNTTNIDGNAVAAVVGSPTPVSTPFGDALRFDGNDGVIVNANPIAGAANFTIEMLFRPDPIVNATSNMPRILHVQSSVPPDHRATLEGRIENGQWYLDAFLRSQRPGQANASVVNSLTLIDATKLHPLSHWYNFAMTYDGAQLRAYLNGVLELEGPLTVLATADGQVSLGMRHNRVNFFEGVIAKVRFTPSVVAPSEFLSRVRSRRLRPERYGRRRGLCRLDATYGTVVGSNGDGADGNRDGTIDAADFTVWRDVLPDELSAGESSRAVPEPSISASCVVQLGMIIVLRHGRRKPRGHKRNANGDEH